MISRDALRHTLHELALDAWIEPILSLLAERLSTHHHGDFARWQSTLHSLTGESADVRQLLLDLSPWRKGPFDVGGVSIDAEWRSDRKWARVKDVIAPLAGRNVLDVGCGNGYYALQMRRAGARHIIGIDPTLLFVMQFLAINHFEQQDNLFVLPLRLNELPLPASRFDTTFSMGVLYHQRSPIDHLRQLKQTLRPGGQLVLETIYLPGDTACARTPEHHYARMRNVWLLPTIAELTIWLSRSGFSNIDIVDQSKTSTEEQRSTEWMRFESLQAALDPDDPSRTVEGWPAPHRVVVTANA